MVKSKLHLEYAGRTVDGVLESRRAKAWSRAMRGEPTPDSIICLGPGRCMLMPGTEDGPVNAGCPFCKTLPGKRTIDDGDRDMIVDIIVTGN